MSVNKLSSNRSQKQPKRLKKSKKRRIKIDEWYEPPTKPISKESVRSVLAIVVVFSWIAAAIVFCASGRTGFKDFEVFVGPIVSLIVAYYFQHDRTKTQSRDKPKR